MKQRSYGAISFLLAAGAALAAACGSPEANLDSDDGRDGGEGGQGAGTGGSGTGGRTPRRPAQPWSGGSPRPLAHEIHGAWEQICEEEGGGGASSEGCENPWRLWFGEAVLGGPFTWVSEGGACDPLLEGETSFGTLRRRGMELELFGCDSDPQNGGMGGAGPQGQEFRLSFAEQGAKMILEAGGKEYVFGRAVTPEASVSSVRLISVFNGCSSHAPSIDYHIVDTGSEAAWVATQTSQSEGLFMDEFFAYTDGTGARGWSFYDADDRGAQTSSFPLSSGVLATSYRISYGPDLRPLHAVGFETTDCAGGDDTVSGYEYDFVRGARFRRFWTTTTGAIDGSLQLEVAGLSGGVEEVLVTVRTSSVSDAADLSVSLTSPDGTTVQLAAGDNGDGTISNFEYTSFADHAATSIEDDSLTSFEALLQPEQRLSTLVGESKNGTWTLSVSGSPGNLDYFGLSVR